MNKILGIDLGTNSIGWAIRNPLHTTDNQIEKFGVLTFNKGVGKDKSGEYSYAAQRTKKRSVRRLYQARKYRLWATLEGLINEGFCPLTIENLDKWRKYSKEEALKNENGGRKYPVDDNAFESWIKLDFNGDGRPDYKSPYQLRKELSEIRLDLTKEEDRYRLGRALYHIAQRRGFKSSRKVAEEVKEEEKETEFDLQFSEKKRNRTIRELFDKHPEAKTIGALFAMMESEGVRVRENLAQHAIRENYKDEIKVIFKVQGISQNNSLYTSLVETGKNKNDGAIFYKRPLRSQKGLIGICTFEQKTIVDKKTGKTIQTGKYRAPVSHPAFEKFRALCFINNIKYRSISDGKSDFQMLPTELKQEIYKKLFFRKKAHFQFSDISEYLIKSGKNWEFNYKNKTTISGCPISARLKEIWGDDFWNVKIPKVPSGSSFKTFYDLEDVWHVLFSFEDQENVVAFAKEKLRLDNSQTAEYLRAWNQLPVGYAMLSLNAINKINKFLEKGLIYTEAVLLAKVPEIIGAELWGKNESLFLNEISNIIESNRLQKSILHSVNGLISQHKNLKNGEKFGYKDNNYQLDDSDLADVAKQLESQFGKQKWAKKEPAKKRKIEAAVVDCYQAYFRNIGFDVRYFGDEKFLIVKSGETVYYKSTSGFYKLPKLIDTLSDFLLANFDVAEIDILKLYHPSDISIYPKAREDSSGMVKLGSPKTGSFKNPMAMRTLHELRKLINFLIGSNQIDSDTRIVVEVARELNDTNKRWAIETWQKRREQENQEFTRAINDLRNQNSNTAADYLNGEDIDKMRIWYEQSFDEEEVISPLVDDKREIKGQNWQNTIRNSYKKILASKKQIDKYRLWREQGSVCLYTGKLIKLTDLFDENIIDFEHTIPASVSFDNSLANLTVCYHDYNRTVKKKRIPFNLPNYDKESGGYSAILPRLEKWKDKVERIRQQVEFWRGKSKKAPTKEFKDTAIRQRHLWQIDLEYWQNKVDRFMMEEVTSGFKNSQKVDTQLISKYAFHYLKTYFERVSVQKGSITAEFRKMYGLQASDEKKDRAKHSHHAKDAAVLTLIPQSALRDELLQTYYEHKESKQKFTTEPYKGFKREFVWGIDDNILINNIPKNHTLSPARKLVRKRGKVKLIPETNRPMVATGDSIRGQLHDETFFGAIKLGEKDENGTLLKGENGKFIQSDEIKYVVRVPLTYKKSSTDSGSFTSLSDLEKKIVDKSLFQSIKKQVDEMYQGSFRDAMEEGVYMLDKKGNKVNQIRRVRVIKGVTEPLKIKKQTYLSKHAYKQYYYASNATNSYFAFYEGDGKIDFRYRNLFETAQLIKHGNRSEDDLFEPRIPFNKGNKEILLERKFILRPGLKVLFLKDKERLEEIKTYSNKDLSNRLYVYANFEKNGTSSRLNFKHHLEARDDKGITESYTESEIDFNCSKPTLRFGYKKYNYLVEMYDFTVNHDGTICWLK